MENLLTAVTQLNETLNKASTAVQDQVLSAHREAAAALAKLPDAPSWLPTLDAPSVGDVKVDELVKQAYDFQVSQLEASRKFTLDLVDIWTAKPTATSTATPTAGSTRSARKS